MIAIRPAASEKFNKTRANANAAEAAPAPESAMKPPSTTTGAAKRPRFTRSREMETSGAWPARTEPKGDTGVLIEEPFHGCFEPVLLQGDSWHLSTRNTS